MTILTRSNNTTNATPALNAGAFAGASYKGEANHETNPGTSSWLSDDDQHYNQHNNHHNRKNTLIATLVVLLTMLGATFAFAASQPLVDMGTAANFAILGKTGISTTGTTSIVGDIGVSPIDATGMTGFGLIMDSSNQFSTSSLLDGRAYASDYAPPTPTAMTTAISDMETAYTEAAGRTLPDHTELGAGNIGGMTLTPGLYKWSSSVTIPTDVTLNGSPTDVWVFQIAQTLDISSGKKIVLIGGARAENIFWQVGGQTTLGTTSVFNGNILGQTAIVIETGATLNGRALAQTAVTLDSNNVTEATITPPVVNQTTNVTVSIAPWYPQENNYILICDANGFVPTSYDWNFGDGQLLQNYSQDNIYHTYADGVYNTTCTAMNTLISETGSIIISVNMTGNQTNTTECFYSIKDIPAVCIGGTITTDTTNGCRTIVCTNESASMQVLACDKPTGTNPAYFEMYKQWQTGTDVTEICIGTTCISDNGFASQSYPYCISNPIPPVNDTNTTTNTTNLTSTTLHVAPWYPQGGNYVFICDASGFTPTSYDWDFGDGQNLWDYNQDNTYHSYANGTYNLTCIAKNNEISSAGTLTINV